MKKNKLGSFIFVAICVALVTIITIFLFNAFSTIVQPQNFIATLGEIVVSFLVSCTIILVTILLMDVL